jgi:hypothetical protein
MSSNNWRLFKSVRPLFVSDIPWGARGDSGDDVSVEIAIDNTGHLIKACMLEIPIHLQQDHFDTEDGLVVSISEDLQPFLLALQDLLHDHVIEYSDIATVSELKIEAIDSSHKPVFRRDEIF